MAKMIEKQMAKWVVKTWISFFFLACATHAYGQIAQKVVDIPTRPGVSQRMVVLSPQEPKAAVILFAGGAWWAANLAKRFVQVGRGQLSRPDPSAFCGPGLTCGCR